MGLLIGAERTPDTLLFSVLAGNGLLMAGGTLYARAFQRFSGCVPARRTQWVWLGALLGTLAGLLVLTVVWDEIAARFVLVSAYMLALTVTTLRLLLRQWQQERALRAAYATNLVVMLVVVVMAMPRLLTSGRTSAETAFALNVPNVLVHLAALTLAIAGGFAFSMLHEHRRHRDLSRVHDELHHAATHDPLTDVLNRRGLWDAFDTWAASPAPGGAVLAALDVNEFKGINDRYGHQTGDACLVALADRLRTVAGPGGAIGRVGGDEFVVLLPGDLVDALTRLRGLERLVAAGEPEVPFAVSVGVTMVRASDALEHALHRADQALYEQKARSRAGGRQEPVLVTLARPEMKLQ